MRVPTAGSRRRFRLRGWIIGAVMILVLLHFRLRGLAGFYTVYLWFDSFGQASPWRHRFAAAVAAAGGLVEIVVGVAFAMSASTTKCDAAAKCMAAGCTAEGKTLLSDAGQKADVATVTFIIGGALIATGAVLWLTSPSLRASSAVARTLTTGIRF